MGDKSRGLYDKFIVSRADGSSQPGGKHFGCWYFVLDATHDPYVFPALEAYADACEEENPLLARDIRGIVSSKRPELKAKAPASSEGGHANESRTAIFGVPGVANCISCGAPILWVGTKKGRFMPIDASSANPRDDMYDHLRHVSHFATCPSQRKPKNATP
jgi:hypothetical protein